MTEHEKRASVEYILAQGFVKPQTFWEHITKMYQTFGLRFIFWDLSYSLIFAAVTLSGLALLFFSAPLNFEYSAAFGFSPILFLFIMLFNEMGNRACGLYELKQTCHHTSRHITALRCICHSVLGFIFAITVTALCTENTVQFFRLLPLCLGGLFLCATIKLSVIRLTRNKWAIAIFSSAWLTVNLVLPIIFRENWETFLSSLPLALTISFAISGAAVFIYQTNKMLTEGNRYAAA